MQHLLLTRYAIDMRYGEGRWQFPQWQADRLELFQRYTLPSVLAQTVLPDRWLLLIHPKVTQRPELPDFAQWVEVYSRGIGRTDKAQWREIHRVIGDRPRGTLLATTRLDSDDMIVPEFIDRTQAAIRLSDDPTARWYNPICGRQIDITTGANQIIRQQPNHFQTCVASWNGADTRYVFDTPHTLTKLTKPTHYGHGAVLWTEVLHGGNVTNKWADGSSTYQVPVSK